MLGLIVVAGVSIAPAARSQTTDRARTVAAIDSLVTAPIAKGQLAGASVAVVKGRDTILIKSYGWADLELDTPTPPDAVYEIGSVTKQFTASAVLQLVEAGKLSLDDDLTKYLPDYPTQGHRITIRRLMDHTSGIKGFTEIPEARSLFPLKLSRDSIVAIFSKKPFDFAPGDELVYNNSGYFLLGLIIEKITGQSYGDYVTQNLFAKVGMPKSSYCSESALTKGKAHGYNFSPGGLVKAYQQDHSWPFAAGSLCSTARDLVRWVRTLHTTNQVLTPASYRELTTPGTLNDGTRLRYAKGLAIVEEDGRRMISHSGGISGFLSETRYYPDADLAVVVLANTAGPASPDEMAHRIAALVLGPAPGPKAETYSGDLGQLAGIYRGIGRGAPLQITLAVDGGKLVARQGSPQQGGRSLIYLGSDTWQGPGRDRYTIIRQGDKVTALRIDLVSVVSTLPRTG